MTFPLAQFVVILSLQVVRTGEQTSGEDRGTEGRPPLLCP